MTESFFDILIKWRDRLQKLVRKIEELNKETVLITLSRKMPRFIEYCKRDTKNFSFLDNVQLTTELAIPFIFTSDVKNKEFIIVDDMIIHGDTLRMVANDLRFLTGKLCHVSCIFIYENARIPDSIDANDLVEVKRSSQEEIDLYVNEMSDLVDKYQLPIDLEFPIFSTSNNLKQHIWNDIQQNIGNNRDNSYLLKSNSDECKFSVLFSKKTGEDCSVDFSKIRFYKKQKGIVLEFFSPTILSEDDLFQCNKSLFENEYYQAIWNDTTEIIRDKILEFSSSVDLMSNISLKKSYARSLCVWANYLLSLSCYINLLKLDNIKDLLYFSLCSSNLSLIIGEELRDTIIGRLRSLIEQRETTRISSHKFIDLPDSFVPQTFKSKFEVEKGKLLIESHSEEEILKGVFRMQHYTNPIFNRTQYRFERLFFGETYESLERVFSPFYVGNEHIKEMHLWIDTMIDKGCIIPKYERLESQGQYFWRRCFHSGLRKI